MSSGFDGNCINFMNFWRELVHDDGSFATFSTHGATNYLKLTNHSPSNVSQIGKTISNTLAHQMAKFVVWPIMS